MQCTFQLQENTLTAKEFCDIQQSVEYGRPPEEQIRQALAHTLYTVKAVSDGKTVGMGRITGDGVRFAMLNDVFIMPEFQAMGIGRAIVQALLTHLTACQLPDTGLMVNLMAAKGKEGFYEKFGFLSRPNEHLGCGMGMTLKK